MARTTIEERNMLARGHVAVALRNYLSRHKLTVREFNEQVLKVAGRNVTAYNWLAGRGMPSKQFVPVLAKTLGKPLGFFEAREAPKPVRKTRKAATRSNGAEAPAVQATPEAEKLAQDIAQVSADLDYLLDSKPPADVLEARERVITHARTPQVIDRERARMVVPSVAEALEGTAKNSLTYWSNGDGSATVTMLYHAPRELAQKVFLALAELGVDDNKNTA